MTLWQLKSKQLSECTGFAQGLTLCAGFIQLLILPFLFIAQR